MANTIWKLPYSAQQLENAVSNQVPRISGSTGNWECWDITTSAWVDTDVPAAGKNPYIGEDHYWYVWDSAQNQYVKTNYSVAQDAVQSVNGVFADVGGNVSLGWANMSGANPISKGGTGENTAPAGLRALIHACSTLTDSEAASGDFVPLQDTDDSTNAKKITLANLINYIGANIPYGAKIQTGSYIGTGTVGSDNPNSITFDFAPELVLCSDTQLELTNYRPSSNVYRLGAMLTSQLTTSYQKNFGFGSLESNDSNETLYAKISADGKTITWYRKTLLTPSAWTQNNKNNTTY